MGFNSGFKGLNVTVHSYGCSCLVTIVSVAGFGPKCIHVIVTNCLFTYVNIAVVLVWTSCLMKHIKLKLALHFIYLKPSLFISAVIKEKPYFNYVDRMTLEHSNLLRHKPMSTRINLYEPCVLYIGRAYRYPSDVAFYTFFFPTNISTEYFKHAAHSPFFSSKCRLFHNATFFGSCIIHILHTVCAKI